MKTALPIAKSRNATPDSAHAADTSQQHKITPGRSPSATPENTPYSARDVLGSAGQPLGATARTALEPRFGYDFSGVRVHTDGKAAQSARAIGAHAYTVGQNIVFGSGQYAPGSPAGHLLLAHELTHVVQQTQPGGRAVASPVRAENEADALAGRVVAGQNVAVQEAVSPRLQRKDDEKNIPLSLQGSYNPSQHIMTDLVAELFRIQQWLINHPKEPMADSLRLQQAEIVATIHRLEKRTGQSAGLDTGIVDLRPFTPGVNEQAETNRLNDLLFPPQNSPLVPSLVGVDFLKPQRLVAPIKAAAPTLPPMLATALVPTIRAGTEQQAVLRAATMLQTLKEVGTNAWEITVDGVTRNITQAEAGTVRAVVKKQFDTAVTRSLGNADRAESGYSEQKKLNKEFWLTSRAIALFGNIKDPGPDLTFHIAFARKKGAETRAAAEAGDMVRAATLLMECEGSAKQSYFMYRRYWEGIISTGETTVTVLETTRDLSFGLLAILAAIGTGGAAVGLLGAAELGASVTVINAVAVGAPLLAKYGEAGLKLAYGDKVNWGDLAQETVEAVAMLFLSRFGGNVANGIASRLVVQAAAGSVLKRAGVSVVQGVVAGLLSGKANAAITQAVHSSLSAARGKDVTWQQIGDELTARFLDPKSNLVDAVLGGVVGYGQYKTTPLPVTPKPLNPPPAATPQRATTTSKLPASSQEAEPRSNVIDLARQRALRGGTAANDNAEVVPIPRQKTGTDDVDIVPDVETPTTTTGKPNLFVVGGSADNAPTASANNSNNRVVVRGTDGRLRPATMREPSPAQASPQTQKPLSPRAQQQATHAVERADAEVQLRAKLADEQDFLAQTLRRKQEGPPRKGEKLSLQERDRVNEEHDREIQNDTDKTVESIEKLRIQLESLATTPYQKARAYSFSAAAEKTVYSRARGMDEVSFKPLKQPSVDHIVSVDEIVNMPGWNKLSVENQRMILSRTDNLILMEQGLNSSKGAKRWTDWSYGKTAYGETSWNAMVQRETAIRAALQSAIAATAAQR